MWCPCPITVIVCALFFFSFFLFICIGPATMSSDCLIDWLIHWLILMSISECVVCITTDAVDWSLWPIGSHHHHHHHHHHHPGYTSLELPHQLDDTDVPHDKWVHFLCINTIHKIDLNLFIISFYSVLHPNEQCWQKHGETFSFQLS